MSANQWREIVEGRKEGIRSLTRDLLSIGKPLPADGGDPARTFREYGSAVPHGDSDYLAQHVSGKAGCADDRKVSCPSVYLARP